MEKLVDQLGITRLSKSQMSVMAKDLGAQVEAFRTPTLGCRPVHVHRRGRVDHEAGRVVNVACLWRPG